MGEEAPTAKDGSGNQMLAVISLGERAQNRRIDSRQDMHAHECVGVDGLKFRLSPA